MRKGRPSKIDIEKLQTLILKEGKTLRECAAYFNCSIPAVSQRLKTAGFKIVKTTSLERVTERDINEVKG